MINGKQFSRRFAEQFGITYQDSEQICKSIFDFLGTLLYDENEDIVINRFGAFKHKKAKQKNVRHPLTGEMMVTPERVFVKFTPSEILERKQD